MASFTKLPLLGLLATTCFASQQPLTTSPEQPTPFDNAFDQKADLLLNHFSIPGFSVAVIRNNVTHTKSYGFSDIQQSIPATPHTLYFTGSTTKAFTSAAISLLVDDGCYPHIQWDTPVHSIIPDFVLSDPWATAHTSIIDMLSHRSGLPRHDWVWFADVTPREVVQGLRYLPLTAEPRTKWQYCNLMYIAAAQVVETVTGKSIHDFLTQHIWKPLGMDETYLSFAAAKDHHRDISQGYYTNVEGEIRSSDQVYTDSISGAGNILSSVSDYAKWVSALLNRAPPISGAGYDTLMAAHSIMAPTPIPPFQSPSLYGLGWESTVYAGERIVFHDGAQLGYGASVVMIPDRGFGLVILGNNMNGISAAANVLSYRLIDEELGVPDEKRVDWVKKYAPSHPRNSTMHTNTRYRADTLLNNTIIPNNTASIVYPKTPEPPLPNPLNLSAYTGYYTHPAYPDIVISSNCPGRSATPKNLDLGLNRTDPDLCAIIANENEYTKAEIMDLFHVSGTFWIQVSSIWAVPSVTRVDFKIAEDGKVALMGAVADTMMAVKGEKIWWRRVASFDDWI